MNNNTDVHVDPFHNTKEIGLTVRVLIVLFAVSTAAIVLPIMATSAGAWLVLSVAVGSGVAMVAAMVDYVLTLKHEHAVAEDAHAIKLLSDKS